MAGAFAKPADRHRGRHAAVGWCGTGQWPVRYDRNTDASSDGVRLDAGGSRAYYYHQPLARRSPRHRGDRFAVGGRSPHRRVKGQDANWRTGALTGEDGQIVERVEYTAYGEPTLFGGPAPGGGDGGGTDVPSVNGELGNAMLVSTVGNPFLHQGLFRDRETLTYHNRFRQYDSRSGRFMQRDPLGYVDAMNLLEYLHSSPWHWEDPRGEQLGFGDGRDRGEDYDPDAISVPASRQQYCQSLARRINNLMNKIVQRRADLRNNPQNLPETHPDDCAHPSKSRRGHRELIRKDMKRLNELRQRYVNAGCGQWPTVRVPMPVPAPAPAPAPIPSPPGPTASDWFWWLIYVHVAASQATADAAAALLNDLGELAVESLNRGMDPFSLGCPFECK